jgi:alpha-galactosidase
MRSMGLSIVLMGLFSMLAVPAKLISAEAYVDVTAAPAPDHYVRYTSGKTIYVEGLVDGRWVGRYWTADGRINVPYELYADNAFQIEVNHQSLSRGWKWVGAHEVQTTAADRRHFIVELASTLLPLGLKVHTLLDGTPVLTRWLEVTNTSGKPEFIFSVSPWTGRLWRSDDYRSSVRKSSEAVFNLGYFTEASHGWEGSLRWFPLKDQTTHVRYDVGTGSNDPFFLVRNRAIGQWFIGHLGWTANWEMDFKSDQDAPGGGGMPGLRRETSLWFNIGPWASAPQRVLAPGEAVITPAVHLGHIEGDLDATVQAMHDHVRKSVVPSRTLERAYRIQYAVPGDQGFIATHMGGDPTVSSGMNEENIKQQIDLAAAIGAELFIVDAGWWAVYGDWTPSATRFPHGLAPIADYAHSKGLLFGLYAEVEGARGDWTRCTWCKEHPDWFLPNFKNILDLTKPEVAAHVESQLSRMVQDYKLDLYRHDYNTPFTGELGVRQHDSIEENMYWRYYEAWYKILEHVHAKYPDLILQQAAAGGMRNDLGMASRWHEPYLTDGLNMPHVLRNYSGQTLGQPPENFVIAFGIPAISPNRGHFATQLRTTFSLSTPWLAPVAPTLKDLTPQRLERYRHYASLYKEFIRPLWPTCKMYHHAPVNMHQDFDADSWFVAEFASPDRTKGWATIVRLAETDSDLYVFRPRGLDPARTYRVTVDSVGTTARIDGIRLIEEGLPVRLETALSSELLLFQTE